MEWTMEEGLGSVEEDLRPDLPDFAVVVVLREDLALIEILETDLKASIGGFSLTMAVALPNQSPVLLDARGCEEAFGPSMVYDLLSDGDGSAMMTTDLSEHVLATSVINGASEMRVVDSEELKEITEGPNVALSSPCLMVSVPSSSRFAGLLGVALEDRHCGAVMGLSPAVSAHSDSGGGKATGDGVVGEIIGGLGEFLVADTGVDSVIPVPSLSSGGMVSEEGLASLAAREALRPPPTNGRRQPPLSPVEPAMVAGRGGLMPVAGDGLPFGGGGMDTVGREGGNGGGV
ncbi:hypothetical protein Dimus_030403 [Dionaea muscipula]